MSSWNLWLNTNPNSLDSPVSSNQKKIEQIGKNAWYAGPQENIWKTEYITAIGFAKIYNESSLWDLCKKKKTVTNPHSLEIIVEMYKIHGFETMLDYLDGDFGFILMDYNIFGEEAQMFVTRDPFGIFPLYTLEYPDSSCKKVSFVPSEQNPISEFVENTTISEMKASPLYIEIPSFGYGSGYGSGFRYGSGYNPIIYGFSSEMFELENTYVELFSNATYDTFVHSYKVSATWKKANSGNIFYQLPFQSTYSWKKTGFSAPNPNRIQDQMVVAIQKRMEWMNFSCKKKIGILNLIDKLPKVKPFLSFSYFFSLIQTDVVNIDIDLTPLRIEDGQSAHVSGSGSGDEEKTTEDGLFLRLEEKYPTLLQEIKMKIQNNDPGIIRAHFIPAIVAKTIMEKYPDVKTIFMGEAFTYEYLEMNMFERRKWMQNVYFLEKVRAWTETFLLYDLEIYLPFLDRMLIQTPDQYSRV